MGDALCMGVQVWWHKGPLVGQHNNPSKDEDRISIPTLVTGLEAALQLVDNYSLWAPFKGVRVGVPNQNGCASTTRGVSSLEVTCRMAFSGSFPMLMYTCLWRACVQKKIRSGCLGAGAYLAALDQPTDCVFAVL